MEKEESLLVLQLAGAKQSSVTETRILLAGKK